MAAPLSPPTTVTYRGRFAPSPTGPLHLGSLTTALASYLDAHAQNGTWLVRIEDIDPPREQAGAATRILRSLEAHGLHWDEDILWQSRRTEAYLDALQHLKNRRTLFTCYCSRRQSDTEGNCGGHCRQRQPVNADTDTFALRVVVAPHFTAHWSDRWQGVQHWPIGQRVQDFIVCRRDGLFAYQLAVVVDDAAQRISQIVRGSDLLDSTARQLWLQQQLGYTSPDYAHLPVLTDGNGQKLSKQNHAPALDDSQAMANLQVALAYLGQQAPDPDTDNCNDVLHQAIANWQWQHMPTGMSQQLAGQGTFTL
ncbi:MAG: tRNA glutamyl-Q(34) synthetase GluQRS [Parahaliea sp.]